MRRKVIRILFALVLVLSFSLVTAVPAAADPGPDYAAVTFAQHGAGIAEWSTTYARTGSYSVELYSPGTADYGKVVMPLDMAFEDLADFSAWVEGGATAQALPLLDIKLEIDETATSVDLSADNGNNPGDSSMDLSGAAVLLASQPGQCEDLSDTLMSDGTAGWEKYGTHSDATINVGGSGDDHSYWSMFVWDGGGGYIGTFDYYTWDEIHDAFDGIATVQDVRVELRYPQDPEAVESTVYVDDITIGEDTYAMDPRVINTTTPAGFNTIQSAIDAAATGDTISVAAGTYNENLVVGTGDLTIQSAGATADTTINAADASDYVVEITSDNVTLDGFTITGLAATNDTLANNAAVITQGVDSCTITNNILTGNHEVAISLFGGVGGAYSDSNTVSNNVINGPASHDTFGIKIKGSHNTISGNEVYNTDTPILVWSWDDSETASPDENTISGNTIGKGADTAAYKWGITLKTGYHNQVTGNTITDPERAAIYLYTSDKMEAEADFDPRPASDNISGNIISGGEVGIALMEGAKTNTISGNNISGTTIAGILGSLSRDIATDWASVGDNPSDYLVGTPQEYLQIIGNTIEDNTITNCGHGIAMEYSDNNTLTGNTIQSNTSVAAINWHGVDFVADAAGVYFDADSTGNVAHYNNITGNTGYGLKSGAALNATNNWWGNASGPTHTDSPFGIGDAVSGLVTYNPWLLEAVTETTPQPPTFDKTLALQDGWTLASVDKEVTDGTDWTATVAYKYTAGSAYTQVTEATLLTSVDAFYLKTSGGGGVGINYSMAAPGVVTKSLGAGWNTISCAGETDAYTLLSQLRYVQIGEQEGAGITNLVGQASYNQYLADTISVPLAATLDWWSLADNEQELSPFDGYWVYMNAAKSFGVIPD